MKQKRVLIAPLDWGLGHATRCVPIIKALLELKCEVLIAGDGSSLQLLREEFPHLRFFDLPGYHPRYASGAAMIAKMLIQTPRILRVISQEHAVFERLVLENKIDLAISDNRYGCWSGNVKSIFITHQLNILVPKKVFFLSPVLKWLVHRAIKKFSLCWIPDNDGLQSITGALSLPGKLNCRHVGMLSRFTKCLPDQSFKYEVLVILSGPEPQRSLLEEKLYNQLCEAECTALLVRGVIGQSKIKNINTHFQMVDFLNTTQLQTAICQSEIIIARSGYSTIMDLSRLKKKAIFIPTPGQTEQEHLASVLFERGVAYSASQQSFQIKEALAQSCNFTGFDKSKDDDSLLKQAIEEILQ